MMYGDQNGFMNQGMQQQWGGVQQNQPKQMNYLTPEEIQKIMKKENQFSLALTETEVLRAFCNHRKTDGSDALIENPVDGTCRCEICGYTFKPLDAHGTGREQIEAAVSDTLDLLQTIKMIFVDMPADVAREYFQIIPLIEKIPDLFDRAVKNYSKHETFNPYVNSGKNLGTAQLFAALTGFFGGQPYGGQQMYQQPQQFNGQPNGFYQQPMSNGFGYMGGAGYNGQPGYQPQTNNFQTNYGQPGWGQTAPQQPQPQQSTTGQAPTESTSTNNGTETNVTATFKA